jgi:hypothetical protein
MTTRDANDDTEKKKMMMMMRPKLLIMMMMMRSRSQTLSTNLHNYNTSSLLCTERVDIKRERERERDRHTHTHTQMVSGRNKDSPKTKYKECAEEPVVRSKD